MTVSPRPAHSIPRKSSLGRLTLSKEETVLVSFLLSREIIDYRRNKYSGVQMHVEKCRDVRAKLKRVLNRYKIV